MHRLVWLLLAGCFTPRDTSVGDRLCAVTSDCPDAKTCVNGLCLEPCENATGHNEDADSLDDACDPCPHIRGDALDSDADGVGDACDPDPQVAHRIAYFDGFATKRGEWEYVTGARLDDDALRMDAMPTPGDDGNAFVSLREPNGEVVISIAGTVEVAYDKPLRQITVQFGHQPLDSEVFHAVEIFELLKVYERYATGNPAPDDYRYHPLAEQRFAGPISAGPWSMRIDESVIDQRIDFYPSLGGAPAIQLTADTRTGVNRLGSSGFINMYVRNLDVRIDYILVIEKQR